MIIMAPKNCNECPDYKNCNSAFGNTGCKYKEEIEKEGRKRGR
jgi:hypothetical protein